MDTTPERQRVAPIERFAGNEHVYDLAGTVDQLRNQAGEATRGHRQVTLFKHATATMSVFCFDAGGGLAEHQANGFVTIHVLRGQLAVKTASEDHQLSAGKILVMAPGVRHALKASEPTDMLLIVNMS